MKRLQNINLFLLTICHTYVFPKFDLCLLCMKQSLTFHAPSHLHKIHNINHVATIIMNVFGGKGKGNYPICL